jgi:hypothetical protein
MKRYIIQITELICEKFCGYKLSREFRINAKYLQKNNIVWRVSPMRELLKRGASKRARNRRRTSVYSSLLGGARNRRKSSHASPRSQHRGCGSESPRDNSRRDVSCAVSSN